MLSNKKVIFPIIAIVALGITSAIIYSCKDQSREDLVAKVGSREITLKQVDGVVKQQLDQSGTLGNSLNPAELAAMRLNALENLIQEEAVYEKARRENLVPDENKVNQEIQKRKQDSKLTEEKYKEGLSLAGLTEDDWRERVRKELAIDALKEREKGRVGPPTEDDIRNYFDNHKAEFVAERGVDFSIIVTDPANNGASDDAIGEAQADQKIKAIDAQLKSGADFATVAMQRSEDPSSAVRGGSLGFASEQMLRQSFVARPEIADRLMNKMSPGERTEPIKDNLSGRWVIFKLNAKREQAKELALEDVKQNIVEAITNQRQQILLNSLFTVALTDVEIRNYLAERIVQNPDKLVLMRPSELLTKQGPQQAPRVEEQPKSNAKGNANVPIGAGTNANRKGNANANR